MLNPSRRTFLSLGLAALSLALPGCPERDALLDAPLTVLGPVAASQTLTWVDTHAAAARVLDLASTTLAVRSVPVGLDPVLAVARRDHDEVMVLSRGSRGEPGVAPSPGTLAVISAAGAPARTYTVGSPFNAVSQTSDGRFAIAHYLPSATSGRLLFNPNEIAVVDLDAAPSATNPARRTVRSFGGVPNAVAFSPPMPINGTARTLAVVLSDAYVTLIDLTNPQRAETTVRLTLPEDARAIRPAQLLFDPEQSTVYARAEQSNDVYALRLAPVTPDGPDSNDFRPTINQLAAGRNPSDMALIGEASARKLLVVSPGSRDARVIDARANTTVTVPLDAVANRILLFAAPSPRDATVAPRALLYATGGLASAVSFLELTDLDARRGQNVETVQLSRPVLSALDLPERGAVMLDHASAGSTGQLSLLDLARRTVSPIFAEVPLQGATFDSDRQRLWVAPSYTARMGYIALDTFGPGEVRLDEPATRVIPLPGAMGRPGRVVALHPASAGSLTVLDAANPQRETARVVRGFLLDSLLDRSAP